MGGRQIDAQHRLEGDRHQQREREMEGAAAAAMMVMGESGATNRQQNLMCPRCQSTNTKFCYYNNYNLSQPRHFCKSCRRYWTKGGSLRNIPVGGSSRKKLLASGTNSKRPLSSTLSSAVGSSDNAAGVDNMELEENHPAKRMMNSNVVLSPNSHVTASSGVGLMMVSSSPSTPVYAAGGEMQQAAGFLGRVSFDVVGRGGGGRSLGPLPEGNGNYGNLTKNFHPQLQHGATAGGGQIIPISSDNSIGNNNSCLDSSVRTLHLPPHDDFTFWSSGGVVSNGGAGSGGGEGGGCGWSVVPPRFK